MRYQVVSADNHIIEAPNTFTDHIAPEFRDRAPRIMKRPDGGDAWSYDGGPPGPTYSFGLNAVAGRAYQDYKATGLTLEEILPGNYDGREHLQDMDLDGVDAATIYPMSSIESYVIADRPFALAVMRAYNDWLLDDFCSADPDRLIGLPLMPVDDGMDVLLGELRRVADKGARGVFIPYYAQRSYADPFYDPFFAEASDAAVPLCMHRVMGGRPPAGEVTPPPEAAPGLNIAGIVQRFFAAIQPFTQLTFTGVFQRFPGLKLVEAEVNVGWLPFWVEMMEEEYERQRHWAKPPLETNPSEFVGTNLFVSVLNDRTGFAAARHDDLVAAAALFSTDYPHSTTLFPHSRTYIAELTDGMDDSRKHAILAGNAMRVFNLSVS